MNRIKVGDTVVVISGNDKNRQGKVLRLFKKRQTAIVENIRLLKKCVRANPNQGVTGGILSREGPIALSKVMIYNPKTNKPDKVRVKILEGNKRVRCFRSSGEIIDQDLVKKGPL
jgi:large subunit ribosomal protein L24